MGLMYIAFDRVIAYIHTYLGFWLISMCREKLRLSVTNLSLENNLLVFRLNAPVIIRANHHKGESERSTKNRSFTFALMRTGEFS